MTRTADKRRSNCKACGDTGLIYPPRNQPGAITIWLDNRGGRPQPVRALPVACSFCLAGEIEMKLQADLFGRPASPEIEMMRFRARDSDA